jgi:glycosidase
MGSRARLVRLALAAALLVPTSADAATVKLFHDTFSTAYRTPFGAVQTGSKVTLRLRVTGAKAKSATLRVSVGSGNARNVRMSRRGTLWRATVKMPSSPAVVSYDFRVASGRRVLWYGDNGDTDVIRGGTGVTTSAEQIPFTITVYSSFTTPEWERGAVVYSIFPDRFRNGDPSNDYCRPGSTTGCPLFYGATPAKAHLTWNEPVESPPPFNRDFFGGDLKGIQDKLPYLQSLGVNAIWLNPIFKARSNHRYDTDDYMHIDPALGSDAQFESLVSAARDHGIRLILDGVFNHASSDSLYFDRYHRYPTDGACESESSPYRSWFQIRGGTPCTSSDYTGWAGLDSLPVFQHDNAAVKDFLFGGTDAVAKHWLGIGAFGWRLDAAQEIDHSWWREFRNALKPEFADAPLIGEVTAGPADATQYLLGTELDGVMNYRFRAAALEFAASTTLSDSNGAGGAPLAPSKLAHALTALWEDYPKDASRASFDLIDSHDTVRALSTLTAPGDGLTEPRQRLKLAALLQYTWVGAPMVFYGDEVAINAPGTDPQNRAPYPWSDQSGDLSLYGPPDLGVFDFYMRLGRVRGELPALRQGDFVSLLTGDTSKAAGDNDVYAFLRAGGAAKPVIVVLNKGSAPEDAVIPVRGAYANGTALQDRLGSGSFAVSGGSVSVRVPPRNGLVLVG